MPSYCKASSCFDICLGEYIIDFSDSLKCNNMPQFSYTCGTNMAKRCMLFVWNWNLQLKATFNLVMKNPFAVATCSGS